MRTAVLGGLAIAASAVAIWRGPAPKPYVPGEKMEGLIDSLSRDPPANYPRVSFLDVTESAGIRFRHFHGTRSTQLPEDMGSGAAWGDFDNDGWIDLFIVNEAGSLTMTPEEFARSPARHALYRNNGDGTFADVTLRAGLDVRSVGQGAAWGDYDNDGLLDLVVTNYGHTFLFHNNGDGAFADASNRSGIGRFEGFWTGASWGDYDSDGLLDLYVCGYVQYRFEQAHLYTQSRQYDAVLPASLNPSTYKPERNLLFHNNGDGTFTEVARDAGVDNPAGRSLSASWADFDNDGRTDLYVANDVSDNAMYRNRGDGTFEDISHRAWVADYRGAMGLAVGDWDVDGDQDIFITHWLAQENALYNNMSSDYADLRMEGKSRGLAFVDVADQYGLGQIALDYIGWGTAFLDYDNDALLDLMVVNGSTFPREDDSTLLAPMNNLLFWNAGAGRGYYEVGSVSGEIFRERRVGRGLAIGDYDNDGDPDAFIVVHGDAPILLRNDGGDRNHWIKVRLRGTEGNRDGVGAKLRFRAGTHIYLRESGAGSSYCSQNAAREVLVGLGSADRVDAIDVAWPSGRTQTLEWVSADQIVTITEPGSRAPAIGMDGP